ncbi:hypothetical protein CRI77_26725 [Mycolicibacterium duvalii]|nr:hypothetical protein CRI77_26725 [Mycolicibacterium duvalii]
MNVGARFWIEAAAPVAEPRSTGIALPKHISVSMQTADDIFSSAPDAVQFVLGQPFPRHDFLMQSRFVAWVPTVHTVVVAAARSGASS